MPTTVAGPKKPPRVVEQREDTMTLSRGVIKLSYPSVISKNDLEDAQEWIDIMKRRLARGLG